MVVTRGYEATGYICIKLRSLTVYFRGLLILNYIEHEVKKKKSEIVKRRRKCYPLLLTCTKATVHMCSVEPGIALGASVLSYILGKVTRPI